ncbi:MAG: SUMF1/EgtB/PvdO family nonheme iron enzyme, partial [Ketobacter sp.]|nr:SUMF1/EgtB/PvdO family nonheme iron enzyme [Ketobacter sp.]
MIERFKQLRPRHKTLFVIITFALMVMVISLVLFPEWRAKPAWAFLLFVAAVIGVTAFLDTLSGAHSLINDDPAEETPAETELAVSLLIQQTTNAILQQLDQRQISVSQADLKQATTDYLAYLVDRYQILDFKGMGVDRAIALPLLEMYVPLKARIELPKGETWDRSIKVGGGQLPDEEGQRIGEPQPVLDLLQTHDGVIILGDPGAGKTTFLKYLAIRLALGHGDTLGLGNRLPILLPLSAYASALDAGDVSLDDFICTYYDDQGIDLPLTALFEAALNQGQALFLLDGLDEVKSMKQRELVVDRFLTYFTFHRRVGNKFALTSRIIGYDEVRPANKHLKECTLVDFDREEMEIFVDKWTGALEKAMRGGRTPFGAAEARREKEELLEAIDQHEGVRRLATNPLLLTILALMKRQGVTLPERRVELYDKYIETLIRHWNLARGLDRRAGRELDYGTALHVLAALALWMHQENPGISLAPQEEVKRQLVTIYKGRGVADPEIQAQQLLTDAREYAGLLVERGQRAYGFIHLTFQEYLAAIGITQQEDESLAQVVDLLAGTVGNDNWHEVTLLAIAYIGIVQQREKPASHVLQQLVECAPGEPGEAVVLAGEAVADMLSGGITSQFKAEIADKLIQTMQATKVSMQRRARAGQVLDNVGDPRSGVGVNQETGLPDIVWGEGVPIGAYTIGGDKYGFEEHQVQIEVPYQLAQYPITNAQFQCFVDADDFADPRWWADMSAEEEAYGTVYQLRELSEQGFKQLNHPRERVSWYQAIAFCRWLSDKLGEEIDLPHEYEWEVAARYPDGRLYPWGNKFDAKKANTREGDKIGQTTAVGMYPDGRNPTLNLYDLSGNVWEWCRNKYKNPDDVSVDQSGDIRTLRGGSWGFNLDLARAASRLNDHPAYRNDYGGFR